MSFGVSLGDVIVCSKLALTAYNSLKDAPKEFEGLRLEVLSLNATLRALAEEANSPNSIILLASPERQESLRILLENCSKGLQSLQVLTRKFPSLGSNEKTKFLEHVKFSLQNKNGPRDKLAIHTASINIFLTSLTHSSLGRLEGLIKNALRGSQQKQQGIQTQRPIVQDGPTGTKGSLAFVSGFGGGSRLEPARPSNVWAEIEQDIEWEGMRTRDVEPYKDEIVAYIRYLHSGGEPFWKRGALEAEREALKHSRTSHDRPASQSYGRKYEREYHRPRPVADPMPQNPSFPQGGQPPPAYSVSPASNRPSRNSNAPSSHDLYGAPQKQAPPPTALYGAPQHEVPGQDPFGRADVTNSRKNHSPQHYGQAQPSAAQNDPSSSDTIRMEQLTRLEKLRIDRQQMKFQMDETSPSQQSGSSKVPLSFAVPQSEGPASAGLGASTGAGFGRADASSAATSSATGSLFGNAGAMTPGSNDSSRPLQSQQSGSSSFSAATPSQPVGSSLFGNPTVSSNQGGGLFGSTPGNNIFADLAVNNQEVDAMADLFDHMFDVDEAESAMAQAIESDASYPPSPQYESPEEDYDPTQAEREYRERMARKMQHTATFSPTNIPHLPETSQDLSTERLPPPITPETPVELQRARLRIVKAQLDALLERVFAAYRAGDGETPRLFVHGDTRNGIAPLIPERVAYLRSAGVTVINCDICSTPVPDYHWHCGICANGDWDCCFRCRSIGKGCPGGHRYLERRSAKEWDKERYWTNL